MSRHAILIANSVDFGDRIGYAVRPGIARAIVAQLTNSLRDAEPDGFLVTSVIDQTTQAASSAVLKALRRAGREESLALLFYFGHGVVSPTENKLHLLFKDSEPGDLPSMLPFARIVEWSQYYNVPSLLFVLDCCYAGLASAQLALLQGLNHRHYLMAAVTAKQQAALTQHRELPIGVFTKCFLDAFRDRRAAVPLSRRVTCQSLFEFVEGRARGRFAQTPLRVDGGLGGEVLFEQTTTPRIQTSVRDVAPKKSLYRKLFLICSTLLARDFSDEESLHRYFEQRRSEELLTPILEKDRTLRYQVVSLSTLRGYLRLGRTLGLLENDLPLRLTGEGKHMCRRAGGRFNEGMGEALSRFWSASGIEVRELEEALGSILRNGNVPSDHALYRDAFLTKALSISRSDFCRMLALSADAGLFQCCSDRTFFPLTAEEEMVAAEVV